jgi:hypothetical protein
MKQKFPTLYIVQNTYIYPYFSVIALSYIGGNSRIIQNASAGGLKIHPPGLYASTESELGFNNNCIVVGKYLETCYQICYIENIKGKARDTRPTSTPTLNAL